VVLLAAGVTAALFLRERGTAPGRHRVLVPAAAGPARAGGLGPGGAGAVGPVVHPPATLAPRVTDH